MFKVQGITLCYYNITEPLVQEWKVLTATICPLDHWLVIIRIVWIIFFFFFYRFYHSNNLDFFQDSKCLCRNCNPNMCFFSPIILPDAFLGLDLLLWETMVQHWGQDWEESQRIGHWLERILHNWLVMIVGFLTYPWARENPEFWRHERAHISIIWTVMYVAGGLLYCTGMG